MNEVKARLAKEKADSKQRDYETGKRDGLEWAKDAHYVELRYVIDNAEEPESLAESEFGFFYEYFEYMHEELQDAGVVNLDDWGKGWLDGVWEFWREVQSKL